MLGNVKVQDYIKSLQDNLEKKALVTAEEIKKRACYLCEVCRQEKVYTYDNLETHHITPLAEDESKGLDNYNLIVLCSRHHKEAEAGTIKKEYLEELARIREDGQA